MKAISEGDANLVASMIEEGVSVNGAIPMLSGELYSPLMLAIEKNRLNVVKVILAAGANVDIKNSSGKTPLQMAMENKHFAVKMVKALLKAGASVNFQNCLGQTPLMMAAKSKDAEILVSLILNKSTETLGLLDINGNDALQYALDAGNFSVAKLLNSLGLAVKYGRYNLPSLIPIYLNLEKYSSDDIGFFQEDYCSSTSSAI